MSKIVRAANVMIANEDKISNILRNENEIFFVYKKKYTWSIMSNDDNSYTLFFYSGDRTVSELASIPPDAWQNESDFVRYSSTDLGTREAHATFEELYRMLKEREMGIDHVLEDIIRDDNFQPPPL